jgi:acetyl esterase/lipase
MSKSLITVVSLIVLFCCSGELSARRIRVPDGVKVLRDLEYAKVDGQSLRLDLYLPENPTTGKKPKLLVWIHGGGWMKGSKSKINPTIINLVADGYAAASIDYRLTGLTSHPKQIHDCKGAIRWLRANAGKYGYDANRIGVGGGSAGGHLVLLLGMSGDVKELEGNVGGNLGQSSRVQAVVDLFGPSELELFAKKSKRFGRRKSVELLRSATPLNYLSKDDASILIFHGDQDHVVPKEQSEYLHKRYQAAGLESTLYIISGSGHGGMKFSDKTRRTLVKKFFDKHIKTADTTDPDAVDVVTAATPIVQTTLPPVKTISAKTIKAPAAVKTGRQRLMKGIYWMGGTGRMLAVDDAIFERYIKRFKKNIQHNPHISGVYFAVRWKYIEPQDKQYKFERLDRLIQIVRDAGKDYKLCLVPGFNTPDFIYKNGAKPFSTKIANRFKPNYNEKINIPLPWDKTYQKYFFRAVDEVAKRYASDKKLIAVSMTVANFMSPEMHLPRSRADMKQWEKYPGYRQKIAAAWQTSLDHFAAAFPQQQLCVEITMPLAGMGKEVENMIEYGIKQYPTRFTIQSDQLHGKNDNSRQFSYRTILKYKDQLHNGFQNVAGWANKKSAQRQGSMEQAAQNYNRTGAEYLEIWHGDGYNEANCKKLLSLLE